MLLTLSKTHPDFPATPVAQKPTGNELVMTQRLHKPSNLIQLVRCSFRRIESVTFLPRYDADAVCAHSSNRENLCTLERKNSVLRMRSSKST